MATARPSTRKNAGFVSFTGQMGFDVLAWESGFFDCEEMNKAITATKLRPVFESHPWTEARAVFREMESATHFGKLVLKVQ